MPTIPAQYVQLLTLVVDCLILVFFSYYLLRIRSKAKKIEKKEQETDSNYHHVVNEALSKEQKILDDAAIEANQIITGAEYVNHNSKEEISKAIHDLVSQIQTEGKTIASTFSAEYEETLQELTRESLSQFQAIMSNLQTDLKKQIEDFHTTLLPEVQRELEMYKKERIKQIDAAAIDVVQKASQEIFNRMLPLADHQQMVIESLEKAKKEGVFD